MLLDYWLLPILFILHDFEEMIFMPIWKQRHAKKIGSMKNPFFGAVTNGQAFSVGVLEELVILVTVALICSLTHSDGLYLAFLVAYTTHFLMHYRMCLSFRGYVPGVVSVTLELPLMLWLITTYWIRGHMTIETFLFFFVPAFALVYVNLLVMHKLMPKIQARILKYAQA